MSYFVALRKKKQEEKHGRDDALSWMTEAAVDIDGQSKDKAVPLGMKNGLAS